MADRQDIDALMVGALYGELDPAERSRLEAHLSSHPEDRAAMQELESTRATVRRGMSEMAAAEPPQAVSAILLQEAARRRGVVAATEPAEREGLWERFVAWFRLVVRSLAQRPALGAAVMLILVAGTATALWVRGKGKDSGQTVSESGERVALETPTRAHRTELVPPGGDTNAAAMGSAASSADPAPVVADEALAAEVKKEERPRDSAGQAAGGKGASRKATAKPTTEMGIEVGGESTAPDIKELDAAAESEAPNAGYAPKSTTSTGRAPAPEPKPVDPKLEEWAELQHQKLVKLVDEGNCPEAGRVGANLKAKAPEYYAANVASDRDVRQCKQYIEKQSKKQAEKNYKSRSQGNTYDDDLAADEATK